MNGPKKLERMARELHQLQAQNDAVERATIGWARDYLALTEAIPGGYPDGTGGFSALGWVEWAKRQLGYTRAAPSAPEGEG